jgi:lysyl-tRNA synthetase, class II
MGPDSVESSVLATVAYDVSHQILQLEFRDRTVYRYFHVPAKVHEGLWQAPSKGHYFNRVIRGHFAFALGSATSSPAVDEARKPKC